MNGLCRDCNVSPMDGDNTYIGSHLKCKHTAVSDIGGQSDDHIEQYSCLPIDNCFTCISFGGYPRGIYGGTPAEIYDMLLYLCQYVVEGVKLTYTQSALNQMSHVVVGVYNGSRP